ncbi:MAG: hypothetical protein HRU35_05955 [Rickettsiaceae bacterium]|nr:hypothetical protein [Rickettsiaceae bacterium]
MFLSTQNIDLIKKHESKFISFKYVDLHGNLKQFDTSSHNNINNLIYIEDLELNLRPILGKAFIDPFRAITTTTIFCENINVKQNFRKKLLEKLELSKTQNIKNDLSLEISFWLRDKVSNNSDDDLLCCADPIDKYANLRSDIIQTLDDINLKTTLHYHGKTTAHSVIGILGSNFIDLIDNYYVSKFIIQNIAENYGKIAQFHYQKHDNLCLSMPNMGNFDENLKQLSKFCYHLPSHKSISQNKNKLLLAIKNNTNLYQAINQLIT